MNIAREIHSDLDDVIVDCVDASLRAHGLHHLADDPAFPPTYNMSGEAGMTYDQFWGHIDTLGPEWWRDIPFTSFGKPLLNYLLGLSTPLNITTRVISANGCHGKWDWWEKHIPPSVPLHQTTDKSRFSAPGRLLIDDSPANIDKWVAKGGDGILVPAPYNDNRGLIGQELPFIISQIEELGYGGEEITERVAIASNDGK